MTPQYRQAIPYSNYFGYRRFCLSWWNELSRWVFGLSFGNPLHWGLPGWMWDIYSFWHRGRYGWCNQDTWSLDSYLNKVLAGSLEHLAHHSHGVPAGFPEGVEEWVPSRSAEVSGTGSDDVDARFLLWQAKLLEWAKAFSEDPSDVDIYDAPDYTKHRAEEERRREALHKALKEMELWYEALWD